MKLSTLWLREWVKYSLTEQELAAQLTMAGLGVDAISPVAGAFSQVVVAQVLSTKPHPDADKLTLCEVNANTGEPLRIVCGAANVRPGIKVALAMIGAQLPGGLKIKESKLRGELSQGMLCSVSELGLAESSEGIMELDADAPLGTDLRDYMALDDYVLDIDLTPNRADCFSMLGLAREAAVLNKLPLLEQPIVPVSPVIDDVIKVTLDNPQGCAHYCGRVIRHLNPAAKTPLWMSERLRRAGIRSLHPIVDIMNYVMIELGQPMHAFDLDKIKGGIKVRFSSDSEQLELLDGQKVQLTDKVLVIADDEKPLAMAGIMGGAQSAVQPETTDVFLESAFFNPITTSGVARTYGLFSDSSQRYERGVDPQLQIKALERATALILSIAQGEAGPIIEVADNEHLPPQAVILFDTSKVERLTGLSLPEPEIRQLLEGLGMIITQHKSGFLEVHVPTHRFDIQLDVDLVEEVIRLYGYDKLEAKPLTAIIQSGQVSIQQQMLTKLAVWFSGRGYHETISYSFVEPQLQETLYPEHEVMQLLNPISSDLSQMRVGMWSGLIASMLYNVHRQQNKIQFFEMGVVFDVKAGQLTERTCVAGILTGEQGSFNWSQPTRLFDFYDLKGDLEALFSMLKLTQVEFVAAPHPALHPGQSAKILINKQQAGWIGTLHPRLGDELDVVNDVLLFELDVDFLVNPVAPRYKTISKYPKIRRDLSFLVDEKITALQIERVVRDAIKENWLKSFDVFDVYQGEGIPEGKKSIALAMSLQDEGRTLVDAEITLLISAIIKSLEQNFSILLRD